MEDWAQSLDGLDIAQIRNRIAGVQAERERQTENIEHLQEKLKALNYELAARKEQVDRCQREQLEVKRNAEAAQANGGGFLSNLLGGGGQIATAPGGDDEDQREKEQESVRRLIEEQLGTWMPDRPEHNQYGIRTFSERELMVERVDKNGGDEMHTVDTVLITHVKNSRSEEKYHLSYRVGKHTTSKMLREDACVYWGISEVEYILWTMNGAKVADDMRIQNCFSPDETAHLTLSPKVTTRTDVSPTILNLIWAKTGPNKVRRRAQQMPAQAAQAEERENLYAQMAKIPGVWKFMTQRDLGVVDHLQRIRPISICIYFCLLVWTVATMGFLRTPADGFNLRLGVYETLTDNELQHFDTIRSSKEMWTWLADVVPQQLFVNNSDLRMSNYMPGWVRIRMQQVRQPTQEFCSFGGALAGGLPCSEALYTEVTQGKEDLDAVRQYWQGLEGVDGRSGETQPWKFVSDAEARAHGVQSQAGVYQDFDASGYSVDYNVQHDDLDAVHAAYKQDMEALRGAGWISDRTRAVHVAFTAYNGNYDMWVSNWYLLELPATGIVVVSSDVDVFSPVRDDENPTLNEYLQGMDTWRMILVILILLYQIPLDAYYESTHKGSALKHIFGPLGVSDLTIVCLYFTIYIVRWLYTVSIGYQPLLRSQGQSVRFMDESTSIYYYRQNIVMEAFLLMFVVYRFGYFMRLNRFVFLIWQTIVRSFWRFLRFLIIFTPIVFGFFLVAHKIWAPTTPEFRTFWSSATTVLMVLVGDLEAIKSMQSQQAWMILYIVGLYVFIVLFFINTWVAVLVQEYQEVRVASGYNVKDYRWGEYDYVQWFFPQVLAKLYVNKLRPSIKPVTNEDDEE